MAPAAGLHHRGRLSFGAQESNARFRFAGGGLRVRKGGDLPTVKTRMEQCSALPLPFGRGCAQAFIVLIFL